MKKATLQRVGLPEKMLPYRWQENLVANQEIGGVFLVFLSGKDKVEIDKKVGLLKSYCKTIKGIVANTQSMKGD